MQAGTRQDISSSRSQRRQNNREVHDAVVHLALKMISKAGERLESARDSETRETVYALQNNGLHTLMRTVNDKEKERVITAILARIPAYLQYSISKLLRSQEFSRMPPLTGYISEEPLPKTEQELFEFVCSKLCKSSTQNLSSLEQALQQLKQRITTEIEVKTSRRSVGLIDRATSLLNALRKGESFNSNDLHASLDEVMPLLELLIAHCGVRKFMDSVNFSSFQGINAFSVKMIEKNKIATISMHSDNYVTSKKVEITIVSDTVIVTFYLLNMYALRFKVVKGNGETEQPTLSIGSQQYEVPPRERLIPFTPKSMQGILGRLPANASA